VKAMIVFISGGVRSGKTHTAEQCVQQIVSENDQVHYIATAKITDEEMKRRIIRHQHERSHHPLSWKTWEQPEKLHTIVNRFGKNDVILLDCLTNLLANELFADELWHQEDSCLKKAKNIYEAIRTLGKNSKALVVVSNEVFYDGVSEDVGTYHFMKMLGWLHQQIVSLADKAILVQNGVPLVKKERTKE
jgi:adenosylcobinamide kinase / adenosylcobinamide-phosphate guanylyltransferase